MASSKRFLHDILDQLSPLESVTYRGMMGEYIGRIYISINALPQYTIKELKNIEQEKNGNDEYLSYEPYSKDKTI